MTPDQYTIEEKMIEVGDGHTFAEANGRRTAVENNSFLLAQVEGTDLSIGSPTATQQIDLGG